ncbi:hypothetical protein [Comamonas sp. JC664]|uniref:hypothetical protein n=1 Tax=Comamonas sp. JC664 TaxID=2801917 RepID=UPI0019200BFA|nr:hypothetical protein [Comamonas sp. JC664]MBL0697508.1 hypothetical protein [Comamonas sp. JC664]GHG68121.1 hypothetical protein GCM10012319_10960 [Comamonas sp. KCTC 72670]
MKRLGGVVLVAAVGCTPLDVERRTERGPLIRTYSQEKALNERIPFATTQVQWPRLTLAFSSADICRAEEHGEYAEDVISTHYSRGAASAVSMGGIFTVLGGTLLAGRTWFSDSPNRTAIDERGRYGASSRDVATGWGLGLLIVGVPAVVAGIVQLNRSGETRETRKADELLSLREVPCQAKPVDGVVELAGGEGPQPPPRLTLNGALVLTADEIRELSFVGLALDGMPVTLQEEDFDRLETFRTCATLLASPVDPQTLAGEARTQPDRLRMKRELARSCAQLPGAPTQPLLDAIEGALGSTAL